jgi:type IV pilus assembly protein PilB
MTRQLPSKPSIEQLRNQAKDIHKAHKNGEHSCCAVLRNLHQFKDKPDEEILKTEVGLQEIQFALAMEYGFKNWNELKASAGTSGIEVASNQDGAALVNRIFEAAFENRASDIHLEWNHGRLTPRFRVDSRLVDSGIEIPLSAQDGVIASIKAQAGLDVNGHAVQDGRINLERDKRQYDLRVSIMPYVGGESAVIRILDRATPMISLEKQSLTPANLDRLRKWEHSPYGLFIISGPTGSGKTTTLYSVLIEMAATGNQKILTCEDPVEYVLDGVNQQAVNEAAGLTQDRVIRGLLRQDPDVIMIGEIRDLETLQAAIRCAETGHLVVTSMHTSDAPGAVQRLLDMHIEPNLLNNSLLGVMAQRLVRTLCTACREEHKPEQRVRDSFKEIGIVRDFRGRGCDQCKGGYRGRAPAHEMLEMNDAVRTAIGLQKGKDTIRDAAIASGMIPIRTDALIKAFEGLTSIEEALRVCGQ